MTDNVLHKHLVATNYDLTHTQLAVLRAHLQGMSAAAAMTAFWPEFSGQADTWIRQTLAMLKRKADLLGKTDWAKALARKDFLAVAAFLDQLAVLPFPSPKPSHPLDSWLPDAIASACRQANMVTLEDLATRWQSLPPHLHGPVSDWLTQAGLIEHKTTEDEKAVAPIERLGPLSAELDGYEGSNRSPHTPRIDAATDLEAVGAWLSLWPEGSNTFKSYRREAERLLNWCRTVRRKPLSSLTTNDLADYLDFLRNPPSHLVGPAKPRNHPEWKPFRNPLSQRSVSHAKTVLTTLFSWLVKQRWLDTNPFDSLPKSRVGKPQVLQANHALNTEQWRFILDHCDRLLREARTPERVAGYERLHFLLRLLYGTGLRLSEAAQATVGDLEAIIRPDGVQYWLNVTGKGGRVRQVPFSDSLLKALWRYLRFRGFIATRLEDLSSSTPMVASLRRRWQNDDGALVQQESPASAWTIYATLRDFFRDAGDTLAQSDPGAGASLARATTHWLRHTHASHALDRGLPLHVVRDNLGHASIQTTSVYLHADCDERYRLVTQTFDDSETNNEE